MRMLFSSLNSGKCKEVALLTAAANVNVNVIFPNDIIATAETPPPNVIEDADSYEGNAKLKADAFSEWAGMSAFSDDSGLEVEGLDWGPGVYSARFAGPDCDDAANRAKMITRLKEGVSPKARLISVVYLKNTHGEDIVVRGEVSCSLIQEERGDGGFGYDALIVPDGYDKTLAELKAEGVVVETHRVKAMKKLFSALSQA